MEAMACGRPVIGTNWGGATAFMTAENSYLVDCEPEPVPERGWREVPQYQGHRWAEPNVASLRQAMRRVFTEQSEAATVGGRACEEVGRRFSRKAVGALMRTELERVGAL